MSPNPLQQNQLLNKEVSIGAIRELPVDERYIFPEYAPLTDIGSDDVFFQLGIPESYGMAPARAEDAEAVLVRRDTSAGYGRASIVDWALKDRYSASDVTRYREWLNVASMALDGQLPLLAQQGNQLAEKIAKDTVRRRKALDARLEKLFIEGLETGHTTYDDGRVMFDVDWQRPAAQTANTPPNTTLWTDAAGGHDPIRDFIDVKTYMYDAYGTTVGEAIMSEKTLLLAVQSVKFAQMGLTPAGQISGVNVDPYYALGNYGLAAVKAKLEAATGIRIRTYDAGRRVRAWGSTTTTFQRFMTEGKIVFLPSSEDIAALNQDTDFGFAATFTSPHPEGGFTPGFYTWEEEEKDPWQLVIGTGIKAFPVMPHLKYTYCFRAHAPTNSVGPWTQPGGSTPE